MKTTFSGVLTLLLCAVTIANADYKVTFQDYDGTKQVKTFATGEPVVPPEFSHAGLNLNGWTIPLDELQGSEKVYPIYEIISDVAKLDFTITGIDVGATVDDVSITPSNRCFSVPKQELLQLQPENSKYEIVKDGLASGKAGFVHFTVSISDEGACVNNAQANVWRYYSSEIWSNYSDKVTKEKIYTVNGIPANFDVDANLSFEAFFAPVSFADYDGTILKQELVIVGMPATAPEIPNHKGLVFQKWNLDFSKVNSGGMDVKALYKYPVAPEYAYTITNVLKDGNTVADIEIGTPNECFVVMNMSLFQHKAGDTSLGSPKVEKIIAGQGRVSLLADIAIDETDTCANNDLVNIWKYYRDVIPKESFDYSVNGVVRPTSVSPISNTIATQILYDFNEIVFYDYDKKILKQDFVGEGGAATLPKEPAHKGLTFEGWRTNNNGDLSKVKEDIQAKAYYSVENLSISFTITGVEVGNTKNDIGLETPNDCFSISNMELEQYEDNARENKEKVDTLVSGKGGRLIMDVAVSDTGACSDNAIVNIWLYNALAQGVSAYEINGVSAGADSSKVAYYFKAKDIEPKSSSSSAEESSSSIKATSSSSAKDAKSSSSKGGKDAIVAVQQIPQFSLVAVGRDIQVAGARMGSAYAVFDMQGHVMVKGRVGAANFDVPVNRAGSYLVRIGNQVQKVNIK